MARGQYHCFCKVSHLCVRSFRHVGGVSIYTECLSELNNDDDDDSNSNDRMMESL